MGFFFCFLMSLILSVGFPILQQKSLSPGANLGRWLKNTRKMLQEKVKYSLFIIKLTYITTSKHINLCNVMFQKLNKQLSTQTHRKTHYKITVNPLRYKSAYILTHGFMVNYGWRNMLLLKPTQKYYLLVFGTISH